MPAHADDHEPLALSVVVVSFNMRRELPRTLLSLSVPYQRNIRRAQYEVILVDNGSAEPWRAEELAHLDLNLRIVNLADAATPSPAGAVNHGLALASAPLVGVLIDGARMASPGLLGSAIQASRTHPRPVVASCGFHLGYEHQSIGVRNGYGTDAEDRLLASIDWPSDGYRLLDISVFASSNARGWFSPMAESNALFLPAELWRELGGVDERFAAPGGGLVNLDVMKRALALPAVQQIVLVGEGTFHQVHGGISSNATETRWPEWAEDYRQVRGEDYTVPVVPAVYFGTLGPHGLGHLDHSVRARCAGADDGLRDRYLELLCQVLLNQTHPELELAFLRARDAARGRVPHDDDELRDVASRLPDRLAALLAARAEGRLLDRDLDNMPQGYTMIGRLRMDNLRHCVETAIRQAIPGDVMECGVWKGGACIFMRGILKAWGVTDRKVWVADSFGGLPPPQPLTDEGLDLGKARCPQLAVPLESVRAYFERFGLLDDQVRFLPGWFADSLPAAPVDRLAVLRLDGDLYSSTRDALASLYDRVSPGGFIIVDDYGVIPQCARAVDEYRAARGISAPLTRIDVAGVYWRKDL